MKHLLLPVVSTVSDLTTYNYPRVYSGMKVAVESEDYRAYKLLGADHTIAANWFPIEEIPIVKYSDTSSIQTGNSKFLFFVDDDEGNGPTMGFWDGTNIQILISVTITDN